MANAAAGASESAFWQFSLAFYALPGVAAACLELQDTAGVDVNVMFYVLFLAAQGRQIEPAEAAHIDASVTMWREIAVVPLRTLRRRLKAGIEPIVAVDSDALRSAVKRLELDAERIEQEWLERNVPASGVGKAATSSPATSRANLDAYGTLRGGLPAAPVEILLDACARALSGSD